MKKIKLTRRKFAIVDDEDYEYLNQWKWHVHKNRNCWYAVRGVYVNRKNTAVLMHRDVMNPPDGTEVDHINHDGLDNRRENLRICTRSQNMMNQRKRHGTSQYKGVSWYKRDKKWSSMICIDGTYIYFGQYDSEIEAARAYDYGASLLFKEFAHFNFPDVHIGPQNEKLNR